MVGCIHCAVYILMETNKPGPQEINFRQELLIYIGLERSKPLWSIVRPLRQGRSKVGSVCIVFLLVHQSPGETWIDPL
jgi:hypothetical protein